MDVLNCEYRFLLHYLMKDEPAHLDNNDDTNGKWPKKRGWTSAQPLNCLLSRISQTCCHTVYGNVDEAFLFFTEFSATEAVNQFNLDII